MLFAARLILSLSSYSKYILTQSEAMAKGVQLTQNGCSNLYEIFKRPWPTPEEHFKLF